ncbi:MAG: hypothetical protein Q7U07_08750 [Gammaproteobacteria bacterium]|nr:hypothetical protein [Gammaproteobacteria bacterium]
MPTPKDRPIVEAALESSEVIADALMHGDVLAEVPLIGTAIKICKAADAIRDRAFAIKLMRFVQNLEDITEEQKQKLKKKMSGGDNEAQKVGETLLFVLERVTDLDKPILLSHLFLAYVDGVISSEELRRLSQAVDSAFGDDLHKLLTSQNPPDKSEEPWMQYLVASGLTRLVAGQTFDEIGKLYYEVAPLAHKLRDACFHGRKYTANTSLQGARP